MDHSHVNGAINLTTITSSTSPSESPNETPTYHSDYEQRTEEQVSSTSLLKYNKSLRTINISTQCRRLLCTRKNLFKFYLSNLYLECQNLFVIV